MRLSWRSSHSVLRSRPVRAGVLFAVAGVGLHAQAKERCVIRKADTVWTIDLDACRPNAVSAAEKAAALNSLPAQGAVTSLGPGERRKLDALSSVLRVHRRDSVYDVRVIAVRQAWTGLHERAVLLISLPALQLLNAEELQALAAHEMGHEYIWQEYAEARRQKDTKGMRELELVCDAIAMRTLARAGVPPKQLQTAIEKVLWFNRERLGVALNEDNYPSAKERMALLRQMSSFDG